MDYASPKLNTDAQSFQDTFRRPYCGIFSFIENSYHMVRAQRGSYPAGNTRRISNAKPAVNCLSEVTDESVSPAHIPK